MSHICRNMGDSELVNESFHLDGGFIAAGFCSAVGTLWSMMIPLVAETFYSYLFHDGRHPQASDEEFEKILQRIKCAVNFRDVLAWDRSLSTGNGLSSVKRMLDKDEVINLQFTR